MPSVRAAAAASPGGSSSFGSGVEGSQTAGGFLEAFWKFLRPHTIRGTILGASAVTARALLETPHLVDWTLLPKAIMGVLALLCGNGYIVGINQIYDVDIDVVNKPFLPIASGELAPAAACPLRQVSNFRPCNTEAHYWGRVPEGWVSILTFLPHLAYLQGNFPPAWRGC